MRIRTTNERLQRLHRSQVNIYLFLISNAIKEDANQFHWPPDDAKSELGVLHLLLFY